MKTNTEMPKMFEHITFVYEGKTLSGVFKDSRMGLSYEEHSKRMRDEGRQPIPEALFNVGRYYVDRVEYFGSVDWEDVEGWTRG